MDNIKVKFQYVHRIQFLICQQQFQHQLYTMLLVGFGLIGLAGSGRKKFFKK